MLNIGVKDLQQNDETPCSHGSTARPKAVAKKRQPGYLRELESICKTVLAHESRDPGVQFNEKPRVENLVKLSL
jgi:hypothetical protein